jgi:hypothetical protein
MPRSQRQSEASRRASLSRSSRLPDVGTVFIGDAPHRRLFP